MRKISLIMATILMFLMLSIPGNNVFAQQTEGLSEEVVNPIYQDVQEETSYKTASVTDSAGSLAELKLLIEGYLDGFETNATIHYSGEIADLKQLMPLMKDVIYADDYRMGTTYTWGASYRGVDNNSKVDLKFTYFTTAEQEVFLNKEVKQIVGGLIKPSMSELEKVKAINDYIVLKTTYSYDTKASPHAAYAILAEGKGVCQAYALLAYKLLEEAGLDVRYVTGVTTEPHAWNLVKVDGQWYHLDTTWNDPIFDSGDNDDYIRYEYFLISDRMIKKDHKIDVHNYPTATSERFAAMQGIESAVEIENELYFPNSKDDIKLYKIDLKAQTLKVNLVSDTRVQHLLYADGWLYFSNYSDGAYLFKMRPDGTNKKLLVRQDTSKIVREGKEIVAYNDQKVIYRAPINEVDLEDQQKVQEINDILGELVFTRSDFRQKAEQLIKLENGLSEVQMSMLSNENRLLILKVKEKYKQMKDLNFNGTTAWSDQKATKEAKKVWTVKFTKDVLNTSDNLNFVEVVDMFGEKVNVDLKAHGNQLIVTPTTDYIADIPYTLVIKSGFKDVSGAVLKQGIHLQFVYTNN